MEYWLIVVTLWFQDGQQAIMKQNEKFKTEAQCVQAAGKVTKDQYPVPLKDLKATCAKFKGDG